MSNHVYVELIAKETIIFHSALRLLARTPKSLHPRREKVYLKSATSRQMSTKYLGTNQIASADPQREKRGRTVTILLDSCRFDTETPPV